MKSRVQRAFVIKALLEPEVVDAEGEVEQCHTFEAENELCPSDEFLVGVGPTHTDEIGSTHRGCH